MDQLHEQKFTSLSINVLSKCCANMFPLLCRSNNKGLVISLSQHPFISFVLHPFFLQHSIFVSIYHSLQLNVFHDVGVVIPSMIWVSICYIAHDMLQDIIANIMLENGAHIQKEVTHLSPHHTWRQVDIVTTRNDFLTLANTLLLPIWLIQIWCSMF